MPGMQPLKLFAGSKIAAFMSVTCWARVNSSALLRFVQYSDKLEQRSLFPAGFHNGPPSLHGAESRSCS